MKKITIVSATSKVIAIINKSLHVQFSLGEKQMMGEFLVIRGIPRDGVLGMDILKEIEAIVDVKKERLVSENGLIPWIKEELDNEVILNCMRVKGNLEEEYDFENMVINCPQELQKGKGCNQTLVDASPRCAVQYEHVLEVDESKPFKFRSYPIPKVELEINLLTKCHDSKIFNKLDLRTSFWLVPLSKESRQYCGFLVNDDVFTINYIYESIEKGELVEYGIRNIENVDIVREDDTSTINQLWSHKGKPTSVDHNAAELLLEYRKPTSVDHNAAELLLELRQQKETKFNDKKTSKIQLWQQIAGVLNNQGYNIEPSKEGGEKCRQKFQNLSRNYIKFVRFVNTTGNEKKQPRQKFQNLSRNYIKFVRFVNTTGNEKKQPLEHYDKLHEILGNKDKITVGNK
ncbi:hypothetical protein QE152_g16991 [Popillia japonica]|uniref:Uncharacterized protein n=1 Tax=Popillia japonica TaxID=7064 RepID=A0AAW1L5L5_POPJA